MAFLATCWIGLGRLLFAIFFFYPAACLYLFQECFDEFILGKHFCDYKTKPWSRRECKLCHYPENPHGKYPIDKEAYMRARDESDDAEEWIRAGMRQ